MIAAAVAQALSSSSAAPAAPATAAAARKESLNSPLLSKPGYPSCDPGPVPDPAPRSAEPRWMAASKNLAAEVVSAAAAAAAAKNKSKTSPPSPALDLLLVGDGTFEAFKETSVGAASSYAKGAKAVFDKWYGSGKARKTAVLALDGDQAMNVAWRLTTTPSGSAADGGQQLAPWVKKSKSGSPSYSPSLAPSAVVVLAGAEDLVAACGAADGRFPGDEAVDLTFPYLEDAAWGTVDRMVGFFFFLFSPFFLKFPLLSSLSLSHFPPLSLSLSLSLFLLKTALLDGIRRALPETHVVVAGLLPRGKNHLSPNSDWPNQFSRNIEIINSQLRGWAEDGRVEDRFHSTFVDCGWSVMNPTMTSLDPRAMPDGVRLSAEGLDRLAACLEPAVSAGIAVGRARVAEAATVWM